MSTQHDIEKEQGLGPPAPSSLQTLERDREVSLSPAQTFPQPPQRPPRPPRNRWMMIGAVVVALALMLSLGDFLIPGLLQRPAGQVTPTPTTPGTDVTPTSPTGVGGQPQRRVEGDECWVQMVVHLHAYGWLDDKQSGDGNGVWSPV